MEETRDALQVLAQLEEILPPGKAGFVLALLLKTNVRNVILKKDSLDLFLRSAAGGFDPASREVLIDLDALTDDYAKALGRVLGMKLSKEEACLFLCLHEIGHSVHGRSESKADEFAISQFLKFRSQG